MNLLETIRANQNRVTPAAGDLGQTQEIAKTINVGQTGKDIDTTGEAAASSIGEQVARQQTETAATEQARAGAEQQRGLETQYNKLSQDYDYAQRELGEQQRQTQNNLLDRASQILTEFEQGSRELDYNKDKAKMEQLGFTMRLSNQQYVDTLQREGKRARLDNALAFKEALQRQVYRDEEDLLANNLDFRKLLAADQRTFENELGQINIDQALAIASAESREANDKAKWSGINDITQGGIKGLDAYAKNNKPKTDTSPSLVPAESKPVLVEDVTRDVGDLPVTNERYV